MEDVSDDSGVGKVVLDDGLIRCPQVHDDVLDTLSLFERYLSEVVDKPVRSPVFHHVDDFLSDGITDDERVLSITQISLLELVNAYGFGQLKPARVDVLIDVSDGC